jgi:tetratricopeptide (TPR) repeat protein
MRELALGHKDEALTHLARAAHMADAAFLAGMMSMERNDADAALRYLQTADRKHRQLGRYFGRYGIDAAVSIAVTPELAALVRPELRGVLLARVELHQHRGETDKALECLERLRKREPDDMVVTLSLVELLLETHGDDRDTLKRVIRITRDVDNESAIHAAILLYKGRALARLGLHTAARNVLTAALRRRKGRSDDLLQAIRYERALVYDIMGKHSRAREEFEKLYAEAPDYEDVDRKLGLAVQ